jgi:sulfite exporter TauE/SafE
MIKWWHIVLSVLIGNIMGVAIMWFTLYQFGENKQIRLFQHNLELTERSFHREMEGLMKTWRAQNDR